MSEQRWPERDDLGTQCTKCGWPVSNLRPGEVCGPIIPVAKCPDCGAKTTNPPKDLLGKVVPRLIYRVGPNLALDPDAPLLDPAPTDQDFDKAWDGVDPVTTSDAKQEVAPPGESSRQLPDQGAEGPEPRSELRRKAAMSGTCPICGSEISRSYTETTEGLVRVELTREEAEAFWNDLCFVDPDSKEDVAPECWSAWQKVRAGWGSKARAALADEGEQA